MSREPADWDELLDTLEGRLWQWSAAVSGTSAPEELSWPDVGQLPRRLEARARALLDRYAELEAAMMHRHAALRVILARTPGVPLPMGTALFVDRRA